MKLHAYLSQSRHGIYYFRWPVPKAHRSEPSRTVRLSLGTRCSHEAGMLARRLTVCGSDLMKHLGATDMDHSVLRAKVAAYFRAQLIEAKTRRDKLGPFSADETARIADTLATLEAGNAEYWHLFGSDHAREELARFFQHAALSPAEYKAHRPAVLNALRKGRLGAYKAIMAYGASLDEYDFTEPVGGSVSAPEAADTSRPSSTLGEAVEAFFREHERTSGWTVGTINKRRAALETLCEWFGHGEPITAIGKREAAAFKEALIELPPHRTTSSALRGMSLREAIAAPGAPKITNATVNSYLSAYKLFWQWAEKHGYASEVLFDGVKVGRKASSKERKPFSQEALEVTYNALTSLESKFYRKTSHRWGTLIAMFSGARLNEVCQLHLDDIKQHEGVWIFDFTGKHPA